MTVAVSIALLSGGSAAGAQESALALEVVPGKLALAPGETADVRVILRNAGASLPGGNLSWAPAGMGAVPDPGFPPLGPNQSHSWLVRVTRPADAGPAGQLVFSVAVPTGPSGPTAAVATAAVAVEDRTVIGLDDLVKVSVGPELEDLHRYREEVDFHLTATSTANVPVEIVGIEVDAPSFIDLKPEGCKPSTTAGRVALIEPGGTVYCRYTAAVTGTVQPGAHRAAFIVNLALPEGGRPRTGSVVVTHELQASVAGESEFLTFLGVPTFLLLPGVLVLAIYRLAARQWAPDSRIGQLDIKLPEYTALSATISIVILVLYHLVTGALPGPARNVLAGYELRDVLTIWMSSVFTGILLVGLPRAAMQFRRVRRTPTRNDSERALLRRLERNGLGLSLPRADVTLSETVPAFVVQPENEGDTKIWVAPAIGFEFRGDPPDDLTGPFLDAVNNSNIKAVNRLLKEHRREISLTYKGRTALSHPTLVKKELFDSAGAISKRIMERV